MNTTRVEHDALAALRAELTTAAGRRISRRRTRRRTLVIAVAIALLLAVTAATAALVKNSTGVPAVDELLDVEGHPGGGAISASRRLVVPEGNHRTNVVAYLTTKGSVCITTADFHHGGPRGSFGGCPSLDHVYRQIARRGASWYGSAYGSDQRTFQLLVAGEVRKIVPRGPGDWRVLTTPLWTPRPAGSPPLRLAVAIDDEDIDLGDEGPEPNPDALRLLERHVPRLELVYPSGTKRVARFP